MRLFELLVYLIEHDDGCRSSMECLLNLHGMNTRSFESAEQFFAAMVECPFGCIVTDLVLPGLSGIELLQKTRELRWSTPTIIFAEFGDVGSVVRSFQFGVHDFLQKPFSSESFISSVKECLAMSEKICELEIGRKEALRQLNGLTRRELNVLQQLVHGKSMKEIAADFGTSFQCVSAHRKRILAKLRLEGDVLLARWVRSHNLEIELCR